MKRTSSPEDLQFSRRAALKGLAAAAGLVTVPGALAACSSSTSSAGSGGSSASGGTSSRHHHLRLQLLRPRAEAGLRGAVSANAKKATRRQHHGQHGRPQHVPEQHHLLPAGHAGLAGHLVRRVPAAVLRGAGPARARSTTSGTRSAATSTTRRRACPRASTATTTWCRSTTTRGSSSTTRACSRQKGYTVPTDLGRLHRAGQEDEVRRPGPARVRGEGRLAGARHVRHPQPADQRLRLPHQADEARGAVDRPAASPPCSTSGASSCRTCRTAPTAGSGRTRRRRWRTSRPA